jgi:hypothetical protein
VVRFTSVARDQEVAQNRGADVTNPLLNLPQLYARRPPDEWHLDLDEIRQTG